MVGRWIFPLKWSLFRWHSFISVIWGVRWISNFRLISFTSTPMKVWPDLTFVWRSPWVFVRKLHVYIMYNVNLKLKLLRVSGNIFFDLLTLRFGWLSRWWFQIFLVFRGYNWYNPSWLIFFRKGMKPETTTWRIIPVSKWLVTPIWKGNNPT